MSHTINGAGDPNSFPDIHYTDSKLIKYNIKPRFSVETKQKLIGALIELIEERGNPQIKQYGIDGLRIIRRDTGCAPNWQHADGMFVDDILAEICVLLVDIEDDEIINTAINHISEQMSDMIRTGGYCPSGRHNRCFQVYMILKDIPNKYKL